MINFFKKILAKIDIFFYYNLNRNINGCPIIEYENGWVLGKLKNSFFTMKLFPKGMDNFNLETTHTTKEKCAIIITGVVSDLEFTLITVRLYKKIFPNTLIILSTWKDTNKKILDKLEKEDIKLVLSKKPRVYAPLTLTFQMKTASEALKIAEENNCKFVLKTRTDWRIYKQNTLAYLIGLWRTFKVKENIIPTGRLIVTSMTSHKYRIYGLTDTLVFGHINDLKRYWHYDENDDYFFKKEEEVEVKMINKTPVVCEIFLCSRYLESIGISTLWTLEHWWKCLAEYFVVVDSDSLDIFWPKYSFELHNRINKHYSRKSSRSIEFSDWLALYSGEKVNWEKNNYQEEWSYKNKILKREKIF